jgi:hypothetical protein
MTTDLALQALLSAVWRRKPKQRVMFILIKVHSSLAKSGNRSWVNPTSKHTNNDMLSSVDYETEQKKMNEAGV